MVGVTKVGSVQGYLLQDGQRIPIPGRLYYRGIELNDIVEAHRAEGTFGFEEVAYLLLMGYLPSQGELRHFNEIMNRARKLPEGFTEGMIMHHPSQNIMNELARGVLSLYSYDPDPDNTSIENLLLQSVRLVGSSPSVLNISSPIKMSVIGILYGGYSFRYQSDFARKTFLCTRRVPQNQVSHSYQYLLATEEQPCFSIGYMNIILQKAQKSIVCCLSGAVPFGSAPLFLFQGGNNHVRVSIRIKTNRGLPTLPDLPAIYRAADEG